MSQELQFEVEDAELPAIQSLQSLILFEEIDGGAYEHEVGVPVDPHNAILEGEDEAHEARPVDQPEVLDVVRQQQPRAAVEVEGDLLAFQVGEYFRFGVQGGCQEAEGIYPSSEDDQDSEPGDIEMHQQVELPPEPAADNNMHHNCDHEPHSDDQDSASDEDLEKDQEPEPGIINMHLADSLEPATDNMDLTSESAGDINMTDQNPEPAGDINTVHDHSELAPDIDQYSEPRDDEMDLDSDTNMDNVAESQSTVLQMHDRVVAETANDSGFPKKTGTGFPIDEMFINEMNQLRSPMSGEPNDRMSLMTAVPSPLPSSQLQPSSSTDLHICESSLEPNLITTIRSTGSLE